LGRGKKVRLLAGEFASNLIGYDVVEAHIWHIVMLSISSIIVSYCGMQQGMQSAYCVVLSNPFPDS